MAPFSWSHWLRSLFRPAVKSYRKPSGPPAVEHLETRLAPATFTWSGLGKDTNWSTGANWVGSVAPSLIDPTLDDLVFPAAPGPANFSPTDNIAGLTVNSLTVSASGYTFNAANGVVLTLGNPNVSGSGSLTVGGGVNNDVIKMNMVLAAPGGGSLQQFFTVNSNSTLTISGNLSGTTGAELTKEGAGTLILSGDDSGFTGPFTLDNSAGVVQITTATALGSGPQVTVGLNSQLQVNGLLAPKPATGITVANNLILNGPGPDNAGALVNVGGTNTWTGTVQMDSDVTLGSRAGTLTLAGALGDFGAGHNLTKEGVGTIALSGSNTYRGTTTVNNGVLDVKNGSALGFGDGSAATGTVVNNTLAEQGTLQLDGNITVTNELLTLNGAGFQGQGALFGHSGNSTWAGNVILGSLPPYGSNVTVSAADGQSVTISGVPLAPVGTPSISSPNGNFTLTKAGNGTVIFTTANNYTGATVINAGTLEVEDSGALGSTAAGTTVNNGGTLELAVDNVPDSALPGNTASLLMTVPLFLHGDGFSNHGALFSKTGINTWASTITLFGGLGSIGVNAANVATGTPYSYDVTGDGTVLDDSLTVSGVITGGNPAVLETLDKLDGGQLILPTPNTYEGPTNIQQGYVTVEDPNAFGAHVAGRGDAVQPAVTVASGAALHLLPLTGNMTLPNNLDLTGAGLSLPAYPLVNQQGALMSLAGINTVSGNVVLRGPVGVGVQQVYSSTPGDPNFSGNALTQLTLTGQQSQLTPNPRVIASSSGGSAEHDSVIHVGATSGTLVVNANVFTTPDDVRIYDGNFTANPLQAVLLYDSSTGTPTNPTNLGQATITVNYTATGANASVVATGTGWNPGGAVGPYGPLTTTDIEIIVDQGKASSTEDDIWAFTATVTSGGTVGGGIIKSGAQRLILQGPGTYTGAVDIQQGVLLDQNSTGLGAGFNATNVTTVEAGTALELANGIAPENGSIQSGINVWGESLVLNGTGNAAYGDTPLTVLSGTTAPNAPLNDPIVPSDNMWRGSAVANGPMISLKNSAVITVQPNSRLNLFGTIDDGSGSKTPPPPADLTLTGGGELDLQGSNTFRGMTFVNQGNLSLLNSQALGGTGIAQVDTIALTNPVANTTTFNLTFNTVTTATPILYTGTSSDAATIAAALNQLSTVQGLGGVVTVTTLNGTVFTVTFGGGLAGFPQVLSGAVVTGTAGLSVGVVTSGTGGTVVANNASLSLQGNLSVAGEPLEVQGSGVSATPAVPQQWFPVGPAPVTNGQTADLSSGAVSGRVTGVATDPSDPNTIYISTAGGGAWKTIDGGKSWVAIFDGVAGTSTGAIAVAPSDPRVIYLGTGEGDNSADSFYGTGVYKSTDSGHSWILLTGTATPANPLYGQAITSIVVDPTNANMVYVASSDQAVNAPISGLSSPGIWRYNGSTWFDLTGPNPSAARNPLNGVAGAPDTPGPDDDFRISFPSNNASWSGLVLDTAPFIQPNPLVIANNLTLYASLGSASGNGNNGVFRCQNPLSNAPVWYAGDGVTNSQSGKEFPTGAGGSAVNGNIKVTVSPAPVFQDLDTVYAAISTPVNALGNSSLLEIEKSTDGGRTWAAVATEPGPYLGTQGQYDSTIVTPFFNPNPNLVYVGGQEDPVTHLQQIWVNTTGGAGNWQDISALNGTGPKTNDHGMAFDASGNLVVGTDGGVWRVDAANTNWTDLNSNLNTVNFNGVATDPNNLNSIYGAAQNNGLLQFTGAPGWTLSDTGSAGLVRLNPNSPNIVYHTGAGQLWQSLDGGGSWNSVLAVNGGFFPFLVDPVAPNRLLVGGNGGAVNLQESLSGGAVGTWQSLNAPINVTAVAAAGYQGTFQTDRSYPSLTDKGANSYDPNTIYVTNGSQVFVTKDHGQTWFNRTANLTTLAPKIVISSLTVDPRNRDTVYAVSSTGLGYGQGRAFVSTNSGQNWSPIANLPDVPTWELVIDPRTSQLYVANDLGVYTSANNGQTWQRVGAGLPETRVTDLSLNESNNTLTAATYGRGMFQLFLDATQANAGGLDEPSGSSVWTGRVFLTGPTTFGANGNQALRNGLAVAQATLIGTIADLVPGANNYVTKTGPGSVVFSGANTYGGITEVMQGALVVHNPQALGGTANGTIVDSGAALQLASSVNGEPLTLNGVGPATFDGHSTGALENVSNNNTYNGPITLGAGSTIGVDSGSTLTLSPAAVIGGNFALTKELTGTLVLQAADTYTGGTHVSQGALNIQNAQALGAAGSTTTVVDGAQLQVQGGLDVKGEFLDLTGTGIFNTGALLSVGGANTWEANVTLDRQAASAPPTIPGNAVDVGVQYNTLGDSLTLNGAIGQVSGAALGVTKVGLGTLILDNNVNVYNGVTTVSAGTLRVQQGGALGTPTNGTVVQAGAALEVDGGLTGLTVPGEPLALNGNGAPEVQAITVIGGAGTFTLSFNGGNPTAALPYNATAAQVQAALTTLPNVGGNGVTVTQVGNTYLVVFTGVALSGANQNLLSATGSGGAIPTVTPVRDGGQGALSNLTGNNTWAGPITLQTGSMIGAAAGTSLLASGVVGDVTGLNGVAPTLTKVGTGTLSFNNANTYAGTTNVNAGILNVQNSFGLGVPVNEVQTITVTGSITGMFTLQFMGSPPVALSGNTAVTTAAVVAARINGLLTGLGINGTVSVKQAANVYTVTFDGGAVAGLNQPQLVANGSAGTGATVATVRDGSNGTVVAAGATLQLQGGIDVSNEPLTLTGAGFNGIGALDSPSGANTWDGPITLAGAASIGADTDSTPAVSTLTIDKVIGESIAKSAFTKVGTGIAIFSGTASNTYSGLTTVANGTLELAKTGAVAVPAGLTVGTGAPTPGSATAQLEASNEIANGQALTVNSDGVFDLNGNTQTVASLAMTGGTVKLTGAASQLTVTGGVTATSDGATPANPAAVTGAGTLALTNAAPTITVTGSGDPASLPNMTISTPITATAVAGITKAGNGILQVTSNDPTLPVTAAAGTVLADADPNVSETFGAVTLKGGTLAGHGSVVSVGPATGSAAGGTIMPGENSLTPTTLTTTTTAPQTWNAATTLSLVLNDQVPGDYSVLSLNGNVNLGGASLAGFAGLGVHLGDQLTVLTTTGTISGTFASTGKDSNGQAIVFVGGEKFDALYTSNQVVLTRVQANATVTLSSSVTSPAMPNTSVFGQGVTITATVTPEAGAGVISNNDTVTFTLDGNPTTLTAKTNNGIALFDPAGFFSQSLSVGSHTVTAVFNGDNTFGPSNAAPLKLTVNQALSTFAISANTTTPVPGQPVTVTAIFLPVSPGAGVPSGTVTFTVDTKAPVGATNTDGTAVIGGVVSLNSAGQGLIVLNNLPTSQHRIKVFYAGDTNFKGINSTSDFLINVVKGTANVQFAANPLSSVFGQSVAFTTTLSGPVVPGGMVSLYNGAVLQANLIAPPATLDANGQATINYAGLTAGPHTITVFYSGNTSYVSSTTPFTYTVNQATTQTALSSSAGTTAYGQTLNLTAAVSVNFPGGGVAAGTVTFYDNGSTAIGNPVVLNTSGMAFLGVTTLGVGSHTITAKYNGNGNFAGSTSSGLTQVVQDGVLVTVSSSATNNVAVAGQTLSLSATVKGTAPGSPPVPNGETITFTDTTTSLVLGTANLSNGTAVLSGVTGLAVGPHVISASYAGDISGGGSFLGNTGQFTLTVSKDATTTKVTSSATGTTPTYGSDVTFTVTVTANLPGSGTPSGVVNFYDGPVANGKILGSNVILTNGAATFDTTALGGGAHTIYAMYADDQNFLPSTGFVNQTIAPDHSTTVLSESSSGSAAGSAFYSVPVTLTATVTAKLTGNAVPFGSVTFTDSGRSLGAAVAVNASGIATLTVSNLGVGSHTLAATYGTSLNFLTSTSSSVPLSVAADSTNTAVTSSVNPSFVGQAVTFTAAVTAAISNALVGTGSVGFYDNGKLLGGRMLAANGTATLAVSTLAFGHGLNAHSITVVYGTTTNFLTSTGSVTQAVLDNSGIAVTTSVATAVYGQGVTFTATVSTKTAGASGLFSGLVTFFDGGKQLGAPVSVSGSGNSITATLASSSLAAPLGVGSHSITASFTADTTSDFISAGPSAALSQRVSQDAATTVITAPTGTPALPYQTTYGSPLTFTATVTANLPGSGTPTGNVNFYDGTTLLGNGTLDVNSQATFPDSTLGAGRTHTITAKYVGDPNFTASPSSGAVSVAVSQAQTSTAITATTGTPPAAATTTVYGQAITFTATVSDTSGGGAPVGQVVFSDVNTGASLMTVNLTASGANSATATLVFSTLAVGDHKIAAIYFGTTNYGGSNTVVPDNSWAVTVGQDATTIAVSSSSHLNGDGTFTSFVSQAVSFSAVVAAAAPGGGTPTGKVAFSFDGGATFFATVPLNNKGVAVTPMQTNLTAGAYQVTAFYLPGSDPNFTAIDNTGSPLVLNVVAQTLNSVVGPGTIYNAPINTYFSFQVTGLDPQGNQDFSANGQVKVISLGSSTGGSVTVASGSLTFNHGVANISVALSKAGIYLLLIDTGVKDSQGNEIETVVTINTHSRQT